MAALRSQDRVQALRYFRIWRSSFRITGCTPRNWRVCGERPTKHEYRQRASAFPKHYYPRPCCSRHSSNSGGPRVDNPLFMERLQARIGVEGRYTALPLERILRADALGRGQPALDRDLARPGRTSHRLRLEARGDLRRRLASTRCFSSRSPASPAPPSTRVSSTAWGLSRNLKRIPIFGLGCVAERPALLARPTTCGRFPLTSPPCSRWILCSLTFQHDDLSVANLISAGLFGDGVAAVLVAGAERELPGPVILATRSVFYPDSEHVMGWDISERGLQDRTHAKCRDGRVPSGPLDVDEFSRRKGSARSDRQLDPHTGGPRVLEATEKALEL